VLSAFILITLQMSVNIREHLVVLMKQANWRTPIFQASAKPLPTVRQKRFESLLIQLPISQHWVKSALDAMIQGRIWPNKTDQGRGKTETTFSVGGRLRYIIEALLWQAYVNSISFKKASTQNRSNLFIDNLLGFFEDTLWKLFSLRHKIPKTIGEAAEFWPALVAF
jgi:hypothetical protein